MFTQNNHAVNQSVSQSINRAINQSICAEADLCWNFEPLGLKLSDRPTQSINQSINQLINQSSDHDNQSINQYFIAADFYLKFKPPDYDLKSSDHTT